MGERNKKDIQNMEEDYQLTTGHALGVQSAKKAIHPYGGLSQRVGGEKKQVRAGPQRRVRN